jgi:GT2 family glycosyltransferase
MTEGTAISVHPASVPGSDDLHTSPDATRSVLSTSVIIVSYNSRPYLPQCLDSLGRSEARGQKITVVDNGSADDSASYIEKAYPSAEVIRSENNLGYGHAANLGAAQARTPYLAFLNPDTVVEPGWLDALIAALEADPGAGLATAKILLMQDPGHINTCGNEVHLSGLTLCRGLGQERGALAEPQEVAAVSGAAFAIRRELFDSLGGFDEVFFMYMEDTDLSWRARLAGYRCLYVPSSQVQHDYALRFGPFKTFYQERNRYLLLLKSLRWRSLLLLTPALLLAEAVTWGFVWLKEPRRWANKLSAYRWIAAHWRQVMDSRRRTQALRQVRDRDLLAGTTSHLAFAQPATGLLSRLASLLFDPLFWVLRGLMLAVMRW